MMTSFEKFALVPKEEFDRLRQHDMRTYDPKLRALVCLDQEMTSVLNRTDISPEEKMTIYQQAQHRFMALFKTLSYSLQNEGPAAGAAAAAADEEEAVNEPSAAPAAAAAAAAGAHGAPLAPRAQPLEPAAAADEEFVLASQLSPRPDAGPSMHSFVKNLKLPPNREGKALSLLERIQKQPALVSFDSNNHLVLNNKPIQGSTFSDLFRELYIHSQSHNLRGQEEFMRALRTLQITPTEISNSQLLSFLKPPTQTGKGRSRPPGSVSKILRLYRL